MIDGRKRKSENFCIISSKSIVGAFVWFSHKVIKATVFLYWLCCHFKRKKKSPNTGFVNFTVLYVTDYFKLF